MVSRRASPSVADDAYHSATHQKKLKFRETSRHFTARGVCPFFAARTMNDDQALALVQPGLGVTVVPDGYAAPGVARPRLADFAHTRKIGILQRAGEASVTTSSPTLAAVRSLTHGLLV